MTTTDDSPPTRRTPDPDRPAAPEPYSHASATAALQELMRALPKSKLPAYFGHLNEVGIVLDRLFNRAGVHTNKGL